MKLNRFVAFAFAGLIVLLPPFAYAEEHGHVRGVVLFTRPPGTYPEAANFISLTRANVEFSHVALPNGGQIEIPNSGITAVIEYPPTQPTPGAQARAASIVTQIESALAKFPRAQFPEIYSKLEPLAARWRTFRQLPATTESPSSAASVAIPPKPKLTITTSDGQYFENVTVTRVEDDAISIQHDAGAATVDLSTLPPVLQSQFHYDPKKAEAKRLARIEAAKKETGLSATKTGTPDPAKALAAALVAVKAQNFNGAARILATALRSDTGNEDIVKGLAAVDAAAAATKEIAAARVEKARASVEAARLRRDAAFTDRPNPLFPKDTSNQTRAERTRRQAETLEEQAQTAITAVEAKYAQALRGLEDRSSSNEVQIAGNASPEVRAFIQKWTAEIDENGVPERALFQFKDDAIADGIDPARSSPGYETTVKFINDWLGNTGRLWFSPARNKMVLLRNAGVAVFDPATLNPSVKYQPDGGDVRIETRGRKDVIDVFFPGSNVSQKAHSIAVYRGDNLDVEKMTKAWSNLIILCGGEADPF